MIHAWEGRTMRSGAVAYAVPERRQAPVVAAPRAPRCPCGGALAQGTLERKAIVEVFA